MSPQVYDVCICRGYTRSGITSYLARGVSMREANEAVSRAPSVIGGYYIVTFARTVAP